MTTDKQREPTGRERRRHVRVRPLPDLPASVTFIPDNGMKMMIVDISLGGMGLWAQRGDPTHQVGDTVAMKLALPKGSHDLEVTVRYVTADRANHGVEFGKMSDQARNEINDYVSELAERGA